MNNCLICGKPNSLGKKINARGYRYLICNNCGGGTLVPREKALKKLKGVYNDEYFDWHDPEGLRKFIFSIRLFEAYPDWIERVCGTTGKIMDVGAGVPSFLMSIKNRGWTAFAEELSYKQSKKIEKVIGKGKVVSGEFENAKIPWKSFSAITFWHVLEHVKFPQKTLKKAHSLLKKEGVIFAEMPNVDSATWRLFGDNYLLLSIPAHLFYYSSKSLEKLFLRNGFEVLEISYPLKYNSAFASSLINLLKKKTNFTNSHFWSFVFYIFLPLSLTANFVFSRFGRSELIRIAARKK